MADANVVRRMDADFAANALRAVAGRLDLKGTTEPGDRLRRVAAALERGETLVIVTESGIA